MRMQSTIEGTQGTEVNRASTSLLDSLKNIFAEIFSAREASQVDALNILQDSKGFDPLRNPQSLVAPRTSTRERLPVVDKRLPVRKAA